MRDFGRRGFLYCVGGAGALVGLPSIALRGSRGRSADKTAVRDNREFGDLQAVTRTSWALGTTISMKVLYRTRSQAHRAIDAAFAELKLVELLMSVYRPDSQLSRLNRDRVLNCPHPYLLEVLEHAQCMSEKTNGAFDITTQPLWELYAGAQTCGGLPSEVDVRRARRLVNWQNVELGSDYVRLRGDGTKITLNGIAQGFAADLVADTLHRHGVEQALIDTGEIAALGAKSQENRWTIGIQHPRNEDAYLSLVKLDGQFLATSGDYATSFSPEYKHHHLFDPHTGHSPTELSSVSVVAKTALEADALSTAIFVMGVAAGSALIRQTAGAEAMMITKTGTTVTTDDFPIA